MVWNRARASSGEVRCISRRSEQKEKLANEWRRCLASMEPRSGSASCLSEESRAVASNGINEFPGDWTWSCGGLVKLGFRNPSFRNTVLWLPAVQAAARAPWGCPAAPTGQPQTRCTLAPHSPRPDPSSQAAWVSCIECVWMNKTVLGEQGRNTHTQKT